MSIVRRVERLEQALRAGRCPACADRPPSFVVRGDADGTPREPDPSPCLRCGRPPLVVVRCVYDDEGDDGGQG